MIRACFGWPLALVRDILLLRFGVMFVWWSCVYPSSFFRLSYVL